MHEKFRRHDARLIPSLSAAWTAGVTSWLYSRSRLLGFEPDGAEINGVTGKREITDYAV
jgi:hypothetical protein